MLAIQNSRAKFNSNVLFFRAGKHHIHCWNRTRKSSMHNCKRRLNWEERQGSTEVSRSDLALPNECTQSTACLYFTLTSPPPSINIPIEDLGCAPAHPARGISSSWKPEPDTVSSLTHLDGSHTSLIQSPTSPSPLSARECADLHLAIQDWTQLRKEN